jgi:hypothetical protein
MQPGDISHETRDRRSRRSTSVRLKTLAAVGAAVVVTQLGMATIASANETVGMSAPGDTWGEARARLFGFANDFCAPFGGLQALAHEASDQDDQSGQWEVSGKVICNK